MKIWLTYEIQNPTTTSDYGVTIKYHYSGTEQEVEKIIDQCREHIGTMLVLDTNNMSVDDILGGGNK